MAIRALTIDFWNTMVIARTNGRRRQEQRLAHLLSVARSYRSETTEAVVLTAFQEATRRFDTSWKERHCTPTTSELIRGIWNALRLDVEPERHAETVRAFEEGILFGPPDFVDGLQEALEWASGRYRLGIISDTMFSPGRVIRRLLSDRGVLDYFDVCVFSDETGFSKPDVRAFRHAGAALGVAPPETAHIGDLRRTDVAGARAAGLKAVLFTGVHDDPDASPAPDAVLSRWRALPDVVARLAR